MKRRSDEEISAPRYEYDAAIRAEYGCFAGVDEAGRGPLCGPVCVAACILDPEHPVYGINDSKKLTEKKREALFDEIIEKALAYRIVFVGPEIIDRDNILNATMGGMRQAVEELDIVPNLVLIDGNRTPAGLTMPAQPVVKGDATSASIGAASVLAKVSRDRYMLELDRQYPQYQLAKHKGYPTKLHYELIAQYGIQPFYRRSFLKKQGYLPDGKCFLPPIPAGKARPTPRAITSSGAACCWPTITAPGWGRSTSSCGSRTGPSCCVRSRPAARTRWQAPPPPLHQPSSADSSAPQSSIFSRPGRAMRPPDLTLPR